MHILLIEKKENETAVLQAFENLRSASEALREALKNNRVRWEPADEAQFTRDNMLQIIGPDKEHYVVLTEDRCIYGDILYHAEKCGETSVLEFNDRTIRRAAAECPQAH